ncbi:MAG: hypothetical protein HYW26_00935 [Candidatus Aenigmarchaeota archaeon]|nr:hypothetical protein [Candidatus Aenigmarchaeota archaeon]
MDIARVLKEHKIEPLRSKDQFFLADNSTLDFEVELAGLSPSDAVLEIGAGPGNLTRKIAGKCGVVAIEEDKRFLPLLRKVENTEVIIGDALQALEEKRSGKQYFTFNKIISNIPYSLSQKLLIELLQHEWSIAVLCVQKEFAEKLWKKEAVAAAVADCCDSDIVRIVPATAFYPPAVDSAIIILRQKSLLNTDFWSFLKITYAKRNRDAGKVFRDARAEMAKKKVHQLSLSELKELWKMKK